MTEALIGAGLARWCYDNPNLAARTIEGLRGLAKTPLDRDAIARAICDPGMLGHYDAKSGSQMRWRCQQIADRVIAAIPGAAQQPRTEGPFKDGDPLVTTLIWEVDRAVKQALRDGGKYETTIRWILNEHLRGFAQAPVDESIAKQLQRSIERNSRLVNRVKALESFCTNSANHVTDGTVFAGHIADVCRRIALDEVAP
jgi:hypothetical protein